MIELSDEVREWFLECGWSPHHRMVVPDAIPIDHPAHAVLENFGGIKLLEREQHSEDEPIEEFHFRSLPATSSEIERWAKRLKTTLIGIGDEHNCHGELYMDSRGRCFSNSLIHDCFAFSGESFDDMLLGTLQHRRHRPLLPRFQESVRIYGEEIQRGDPRIWDDTKTR